MASSASAVRIWALMEVTWRPRGVAGATARFVGLLVSFAAMSKAISLDRAGDFSSSRLEEDDDKNRLRDGVELAGLAF